MNKFIDIRIIGDTPEINELLIILRKIKWCGSIGAGRTLPIYIDGDGTARLDFLIKDVGESEQFSSKEINKNFTNIDELIKLSDEKMKKVSDGDDFETHYIGE